MLRINDEFTNRKGLSKQRRYQLRKQRDRRCQSCGQSAQRSYCELCRLTRNVRTREANRRRHACKTRRLHCESYLFEAELRKLTRKAETLSLAPACAGARSRPQVRTRAAW